MGTLIVHSDFWAQYNKIVSISNSHQLTEFVDRKVEGYGRPEKHYESIQHN